MALTPGTRLGPYEVVGLLGAGGMGEVYKAQDTRLRRAAALKLLPPDLTRDATAKKRFLQEAQAASALDHPNICTIYEIGETPEGQLYLAMAYYEGETLRARIERGPLPIAQALDVAIQVGEGLAEAHAAGIVHRDIKPANLMCTKTGMKILDFGLAKLAGAEGLTQTGTTLGTVSYMSPEQARAETVNARTDLWSLGVVLYEMVTGQLPFKGDSLLAVATAILHSQPALLTGVRTGVPLDLERVVNRTLAKPEADRYQTVADLLSELRSVKRALESGQMAAAPAAEKPVPSIAVLPFADMSPQKDQDYFCEGMAEEILNALNGIEGLHVVSRTSAFQFKEKAQDVRRIGEALNVKAVLEGSVRTAGKRLRVMAQLTNVEDGYQLWSEKYDRELEDVFAIQDEISARIAEALRVKLVGGPGAAAKRQTDNVEAYQLFLKGRYSWYKREKDALQKAVAFFEKAVEQDPSFALAHAGIAESYCSLGLYGLRPDIASARATAAVEQALAIDDSMAEAHAALGMKRYYLDWDWPDAERELKRGLELNSSYVLAYCWYAYLLAAQGRHDGSVDAARRAQELDPLSPFVNTVAGIVLLAAARNQEAIEELGKAVEIEGDFLLALYTLGAAYSRCSRHDEAVALIERAATVAGRGPFVLGWLGWAYGAAGRRADAGALLQELSARAERDYVAPPFFAWILSALDRNDEAFEYLEKAYEERHPFLAFHMIPTYDHLRSDSRYHQLLQRMKLRPSPTEQ